MLSDADPPRPPAIDQAQLALERTLLAYERTQMAWIRTSISLITLGFSMYKFVMYLHEEHGDRHSAAFEQARLYGMAFIGIGVLTLAGATVQHRIQLRNLRRQFPGAPYSLATVVAGLIAIIGLIAFFAALVRV